MQSLRLKDATIAYEDMGSGPPVLFLHCSSGTHREWLFAARELADMHRCLLPDLMGYGKTTGQFDDNGDAIDCRDADVIAAMAEQAGEPVHIVAHSYGAATTIEFVRSRPKAVRSLFLVEPVCFQLLDRPGYETEWRRVGELADDIIGSYAAGHAKRAAHHYMSYWLGTLRWLFAPRKFRRSVIRTVGKVAFEFSQIYVLPRDLDVFAGLDVPVTFATGGRTRREAEAVTEILCGALPRARNIPIDGAGHMSPFTHSQQLLDLVRAHLSPN